MWMEYWQVLGGMDGILGSNGRDWLGYWVYWEGLDGILGSNGRGWILGVLGRGYWGDLEMLVGYWKVLGGVAWDTGGTGRGYWDTGE